MKLPKKIYVKVENEGDDAYLIAHEEIDNMVDLGETIEIGVYVLERKVKASTTVVVTEAV